MIDLIERKIVAIIPKYSDVGDITVVYTKDGKRREIYTSLRTFLKKLFFFYTVDYLALKNKFRGVGIHQNAPLILRGEVYMKVKVRKPLAKSDGAYGYVNVKYVKRILRNEKYGSLEMSNGLILKSLSSYTTLSTNFVIAKSIRIKDMENSYLKG